MADSIREAKRALRTQVQGALSEISAPERAAASARARARLKQQALWRDARSVLFYAPISQELDIWPLLGEALSESRQVLLPRFIAAERRYEVCQVSHPDTDLQPGHFGIREPANHCSRATRGSADLILVPGIAFDRHGRRLGRGKGYYDRLLEEIKGIRCGVAFEAQVVNEIPVEPHDVRLNYILTPERWISVGPGGKV